MTQSNAEITKHWLGDRPEGRRPAFFWILHVRIDLLKHCQQGSADQQCQQSRHHKQLCNRFVARLELLQTVPRLQLTEQQFDLPPQAVQRRYLLRRELIREIRHVEVIVVGVLVADTDDAELCCITRLLLTVRSSFELESTSYVDMLSLEVRKAILEVRSRQGNGAPAP